MVAFPPRPVLYVGGTDSGGGAGLLADIKACEANGGFACVAVTAATAQNTRGVSGVSGIESDFVIKQIDAVLEDIGSHAVKTGMLATAELIKAVASRIGDCENVVVDPVMVTANGDVLVDDGAVDAVKCDLLPIATITTPNLREAALLLGGKPLETIDDAKAAAVRLCRLGPGSVLVKGCQVSKSQLGDDVLRLDDDETSDVAIVDVFYDSRQFVFIATSKVETRNTHGTGCTLASAIAARLADGDDVLQAVQKARTYLYSALKASTAIKIGTGKHGPFLHAPRWQQPSSKTSTSS